jgi:hypothetical protein
MTAVDSAAIDTASHTGGSRWSRLSAWLHNRPSFWQAVLLLLAVLVIQLAWSVLGMVVVAMSSGPVAAPPIMRWLVLEAPIDHALMLMALGVAIEEIGFRLLPLGAALAIYKEYPGCGWLVATIAVVSSVAFGLLHGLEWYRLMLQAVGGLLYAVVFLKVSGMDGAYWKRAIVATFALHLVFNSVILVGTRIAQTVA